MRKRRAAMILPFSENGGLHYRFIVPELSNRLTRGREPRHTSAVPALPASFRHIRRGEFTRVKRRRFAHLERAAARRQWRNKPRPGAIPHCVPFPGRRGRCADWQGRSEEHTSELQSLMRISYAVFCLKKKNNNKTTNQLTHK